MMEEKNYVAPQEQEEQEIDLMALAMKLWAKRKLLLKVGCYAALFGVLIALTTPKVYTVNAVLAPELGSKSASSSLASAASMLGLGNLSMGSDADALRVTLYPEVVSSLPFMVDLMDTPVQTKKGQKEELPLEPLHEVLKKSKKSLVGTVVSFPFKVLGTVLSWFRSDEEERAEGAVAEVNPFQLTKKQANIIAGLRKQILATVDKKTGVTTVSVTMQDPLVAAMVADTVIEKLRVHITKYRTSKAQEDCAYWEQLNEERRQEYYEAQQRYARYVDANKNVILQSVLTERERLQNEMNLAYQVYTNVATQMQLARAKVQEAKPVFAVVEPASVPLKASGTSRKMIVLQWMFLAVFATAAWVLFGQDMWDKLRESASKEQQEA